MKLYNLCILVTSAVAHSWVEKAILSAQELTGLVGFPRGNVPRESSLFSDDAMTNLLLPSVRKHNVLEESDLICKDTQSTYNYTNGSPALQNGHVTKLHSTPNKASSGLISVYGTANPQPSDTLRGVQEHGQLLSRAPFDDGTCYQINNTPESVRRRGLPQRRHWAFEGADLWCTIAVHLPSDLRKGSTYTLYWVWDWPSSEGGHHMRTEIYTTCLDILVE
ncbi:hypothetical protein DM02DRAFT_700074 [Periconia macrospinosa]|uniref:DUF7492 domain-containing protein n=1 Tax=Periconia macrospinosa TaxID=97972 RepID=A0A2V1D2W5_9PLEO|nr:hypothetical protein DM02DRAFT_700074 [Periconia macrospinosa]